MPLYLCVSIVNHNLDLSPETVDHAVQATFDVWSNETPSVSLVFWDTADITLFFGARGNNDEKTAFIEDFLF